MIDRTYTRNLFYVVLAAAILANMWFHLADNERGDSLWSVTLLLGGISIGMAVDGMLQTWVLRSIEKASKPVASVEVDDA